MRPAIFILSVIFNYTFLSAQKDYSEAREMGDSASKKGDYEKAINFYIAAWEFNSSDKVWIRRYINGAFNDIYELKEQAQEKGQKQIADSLLNLANTLKRQVVMHCHFKPETPRILIITCPKNLLNTEKYQHNLKFGQFGWKRPKKNGKIYYYKTENKFYRYSKDTIVDIVFYIRKISKPGYFYYHTKETVILDKDTVYFEIPPLDSEENIKAILKEQYRGEAFSYFLHSWESHFLTVSFFQGHRPFGEILYSPARYSEGYDRLFKFFWTHISNFSIGSEFNFKWNKEEFILGPKIGWQYSGNYLNLGVHAVYYTDFNHGLFCIKPQIGICPSIPFVTISYSYAIRFGPDNFGSQINAHQLCLNFHIPLKLKEY